MKDLAIRLVDHLAHVGVDYGDVRVILHHDETITVRNERPEVVRSGETQGYGVRVMRGGRWGFAACSDFTSDRMKQTIDRAVSMAEAAGVTASFPDPFEPPPPAVIDYCTPYLADALQVGLADKLQLLTRCTQEMAAEPSVKQSEAYMDALREHKVFASTTGSVIQQETIECGAGISAYAIENGQMQVRSYPSSFRGNFATAGYEFIDEMDLLNEAPRVASEAAQLLRAPVCPDMTTDLIVMPDQLALQIHESIGHAVELDRIFGYEASFAGTSFVQPEDVGTLSYGSKLVNVYADSTCPRGLGTFAYDDEGVPAQRDAIIRNGVLVGVLSSCSTAPRIGLRSNGCMRANGWSNFPIVRMTNVSLEPGEWELDALIDDTKHGLLVETNRSWSIDDKRINFQFSTEVGREIRNGKVGRLFKNSVYTGISPQFWSACNAICNRRHWRLWGIPNCGKGEPMQVARVGHGCAPARFHSVKVTGSAE